MHTEEWLFLVLLRTTRGMRVVSKFSLHWMNSPIDNDSWKHYWRPVRLVRVDNSYLMMEIALMNRQIIRSSKWNRQRFIGCSNVNESSISSNEGQKVQDFHIGPLRSPNNQTSQHAFTISPMINHLSGLYRIFRSVAPWNCSSLKEHRPHS